MKKVLLITLIALIGFSFAACGGGDDSELSFTSVADFKAWLDAQPDNTAATAYHVKLNVSDLGGRFNDAGSLGNALFTNRNNKYVNLDLSGSTLTSIGFFAFMNCTSLTSITIPSSVTSIENNAFAGCTSLTSVTIPSSVTSIGDGAFQSCIAGTITIPNSVTSIGDYAFRNCTSLTSVAIGSGVTSIGEIAFNGCTSLISVRFERVGTTFTSTGDIASFIDATNSASLQTAYTGGGIGTYTRPNTTSTAWTKS